LELNKQLATSGFLACIIAPGPHLKMFEKLPGGLKPEEFDSFCEFIAHEELGRTGAPGFTDGIAAGMVISLPAVVAFGPKWMKEKVAKEVLLDGTKRICLAITEPYAGSDVARIRTTAKLSADGTYWILNGQKKWITNGVFCDYFVVLAQTEKGPTMFLMERSEGLRTK
jgi:alkylation response protein AidB-like acyl-CoA dehydrogenase